MRSSALLRHPAVLALLAALAPPVGADDMGVPVTRACRIQVGVVCPGLTEGSDAMRQCLERHPESIAEGCREAMLAVPPPPPPRDLRTACRSDFERLCSETVGPDARRGLVLACLRSNVEQLAAECRDALAKPRRRVRRFDQGQCYHAVRALCGDADTQAALEDCARFRQADLPVECRPKPLGAR